MHYLLVDVAASERRVAVDVEDAETSGTVALEKGQVEGAAAEVVNQHLFVRLDLLGVLEAPGHRSGRRLRDELLHRQTRLHHCCSDRADLVVFEIGGNRHIRLREPPTTVMVRTLLDRSK